MSTHSSDPSVLKMTSVSRRFGGGFRTPARLAVDGVDISLTAGTVLGLVGESGSGKSTIGRMAVGLLAPSAGSVEVLGEDLSRLGRARLREKRRSMQMIFQDSSSSLNPRMTLLELLTEPLRVQGLYGAREREARARALADEVELPASAMRRFVHEFSGGQRQRISIARALALEPSFIVADEPVSALDVSVQAKVLNLLKDVRERRELSLLFISHDMAVVEFMSDEVMVLRNGSVVERAGVADLFTDPQTAYTRELLDSSPSLPVE